MNQPTQMSYSALSKFEQCPSMWRATYIDKIQGPVGDAAKLGNAFDQSVAARLGLPTLDHRSGRPVPTPEMTPELKDMLDAYDAFPQSWLRTTPEQQPRTQVKIFITPEQWCEIATRYGANPTVHYPIVGYLDMVRLMSDGVRLEILDLKTAKRKDFQPGWNTQIMLYAAALDAAKVSIHLVSQKAIPKAKGGGRKYEVTPYSMFVHANKPLVKAVLNKIAYRSNEVKRVVDANELVDLPENTGFWCGYCPLQMSCATFGALKGHA